MSSVTRAFVLLLPGLAALACGRPDTPRLALSPATGRVEGVRVAVLPASTGSRMIGSCSPTPDDAPRDWHPSGYWEPDAAMVRQVEARLTALLDSVLPEVARTHRLELELRGEDYYRQYLGITRRGERLVYVHGFHQVLVQDESPDRERWKVSPMDVCDAGPALFGVVYDPRTRTFGRLEVSDVWYPAVRP